MKPHNKEIKKEVEESRYFKGWHKKKQKAFFLQQKAFYEKTEKAGFLGNYPSNLAAQGPFKYRPRKEVSQLELNPKLYDII